MSTNEFGFDEVVDTLCDIVEVGDQAIKPFADGFQLLPDIVALTPLFPRIQEIVMDAPLAWKQFKDLTVEESNTVQERVAARLDLSNDIVEEKIKSAIRILTRVYSLLAVIMAEFKAIKKDLETSF